MQQVLKVYFRLYYFVASERIEKKDLQERYIHSHLVCVLSTGLLMWAYALLAQLTIISSIPMQVGYTCSLIHLLSPLLYRISNNHFLNSSVFIGAGMLHQATFAYFTGGFDSDIIIWFGILPMLGGVVSGRKSVAFWSTVTSTIVICFFIKKLFGSPFPNEISDTGKTIAHLLLTLGWIFLSTIIIWVYVLLEEMNTLKMEQKNQSIQNLVYILAHDISNYLTIILGRMSLIKKKIVSNKISDTIEMPFAELDNLEKIQKAAQTINKIVDNVKELYSTELGKKEIELTDVTMAKVFAELKESYCEKLEHKKLELICVSKNSNLIFKSNQTLMTHQILGNLVSNAIKFSKVNSKITLEAQQIDQIIQIKVIDRGVGIPESILQKLFELKAVTSRVGTNGEDGTGFGLPIVKVYVEKLGGKIRVESIVHNDEKSESGTTFILEFPMV